MIPFVRYGCVIIIFIGKNMPNLKKIILTNICDVSRVLFSFSYIISKGKERRFLNEKNMRCSWNVTQMDKTDPFIDTLVGPDWNWFTLISFTDFDPSPKLELLPYSDGSGFFDHELNQKHPMFQQLFLDPVVELSMMPISIFEGRKSVGVKESW